MKIKVNTANSFWDKTLGLLDSRNSAPMLFKTRFGVHTFFMNRPIDVLVLDNQGVIKVLNEKMTPFRFFFYNPKYSTVVETESGFITKNNLTLNDKITLTYC